MEYNSTDFETCPVNPFWIPDKKFVLKDKYLIDKGFDKRQRFKDYNILKDKVDLCKVLKYCACVYQWESPLMQIDTVLKRKIVAAEIAEFETDKETNHFLPEYENIIKCKDEEVNKVIIEFLKMLHDEVWMILAKTYDFLQKELEEYDTETDATKRVAINRNIADHQKRIKELKKEFLAEDSSRDLKLELFKEIGLAELPVCEHIAEILTEGKDLPNDYNPYGSDYKPEKLIFKPDEN